MSSSKDTWYRHVFLPPLKRVVGFGAAQPRLRLFAQFLVLFALFFVVAWRKLDPDFGWHLQSGLYIRAHGVPTHDIFTYTAPHFPWINHEWGNDVIVSWLYGLGGYGLLAVLYAGLWGAALVIAGRRARLGVLLLAAAAVFPYAGIRPVSWTVLFLAVTFRAIWSPRRRLIWLLPLLFVPWANLHAGFIIGLVIILYSAVYYRRPALFGIFGLAALATCLNIYGPRLYVEVGRTLFDPSLHRQVAEWAPLSFVSLADVFIIVWGAGGVLFEQRSIRRWLRPSVPLLLASISANRNLPLFVISAAAECSQYVTTGAEALLAAGGKLVRRGLLLAALAVVLATAYWARSEVWPINQNREAAYPRQAVAYLRLHACGGRLFNDYNYGGYLIWRLDSKVPVYIDGRMPSWKDETGQKYMTRYYQLLAHPEQYRTEFARYGIHCALLGHGHLNGPMITRLERDGWRPVIDADGSVLLLAPKP